MNLTLHLMTWKETMKTVAVLLTYLNLCKSSSCVLWWVQIKLDLHYRITEAVWGMWQMIALIIIEVHHK